MKQKISITIDSKTLGEIDSIIDNIYIRNRSQAIELLVSNALGENKTAIILSGGNEETLRIDSDYRITSKIGNLRLIELSIKKLREDGFKHIIMIARHNLITEVFKIVQNGSKYGVNIDYIDEASSKGTADSLRYAKGKVKNSFLVVYGDIIFNKVNIEELWNTHIKQKGIATLLLTTTPTPNKKGIVKIEGSTILDFQQKPKSSDNFLGFSSIFVENTEILEYSGSSLEEDIFPQLAKKGLLQGHLSANKEIHIHTKEDIDNAERLIKTP